MSLEELRGVIADLMSQTSEAIAEVVAEMRLVLPEPEEGEAPAAELPLIDPAIEVAAEPDDASVPSTESEPLEESVPETQSEPPAESAPSEASDEPQEPSAPSEPSEPAEEPLEPSAQQTGSEPGGGSVPALVSDEEP